MKILAIETSCDDTAISIIDAKGDINKPKFKILAQNISSQIDIHQKWGGVVPSLAKREHGKNLIPLLIKSLQEAKLYKPQKGNLEINFDSKKIDKILEREENLKEDFYQTIKKIKTPKIDFIAVTEGPGLEPALWVGINLARALSYLWNIPIITVNHLEGHILSAVANNDNNKISFPLIALIASGGHTELVLSNNWLKYKIIGRTRDDAVGEAFDKVARILGLPYPGGPEISKLADYLKTSKSSADDLEIKLPRPMINSNDFDFSFSGLKTAVLYLVRRLETEGKINKLVKAKIANEFQQASIDVLISKTFKAVSKYKTKTLVVGGGVIANLELRKQLQEKADNWPEKLNLLIPEKFLSTDNATMIAVVAYFHSFKKKNIKTKKITAQGNLSLK